MSGNCLNEYDRDTSSFEVGIHAHTDVLTVQPMSSTCTPSCAVFLPECVSWSLKHPEGVRAIHLTFSKVLP